MSNYGGLALWQTALGDSILGHVAPTLKLLLGWGLALEEALVDEIRDVVHHVFGHLSLSRCAAVGANSAAAASAIALVCWVAVCTCSATPLAGVALVLGLHFSMRSTRAPTASLKPSYSAHAALVSSTEPKHIAHVRFG
jgi:hypothetical protein